MLLERVRTGSTFQVGGVVSSHLPIPVVSNGSSGPTYTSGWLTKPWGALSDPVLQLATRCWIRCGEFNPSDYFVGYNADAVVTEVKHSNPVSTKTTVPRSNFSAYIAAARDLMQGRAPLTTGAAASKAYLELENECAHATYKGTVERRPATLFMPEYDSNEQFTQIRRTVYPQWWGSVITGFTPGPQQLHTRDKTGGLLSNALKSLPESWDYTISSTAVTNKVGRITINWLPSTTVVDGPEQDSTFVQYSAYNQFDFKGWRYFIDMDVALYLVGRAKTPSVVIGSTAQLSLGPIQDDYIVASVTANSYRVNLVTGASDTNYVPNGRFYTAFTQYCRVIYGLGSSAGSFHDLRSKAPLSAGAYITVKDRATYNGLDPEIWAYAATGGSIAGALAIANAEDFIMENHIETLAELSSLTDFIDPLKGIMLFQRRLRKRDLFGATRSFLDVLASAKLTYSFGVTPTYEAARELAQNGGNIVRRLQDAKLLSTPITGYGKHVFSLPTEVSLRHFGVLGAVLTIRAKVRFKYSDLTIMGAVLPLKAFGLLPSLSNGWDLVSYSWLIDQFTGIGNKLSIADSQLQSILFEVVGSTVSYEFSVPITDLTDHGLVALENPELQLYQRVVLPRLPSAMPTEWDLLPGSGFRMDIGIAFAYLNLTS